MFMLKLSKNVWRKLKKSNWLIHTNFLIMISITLFYCCERNVSWNTWTLPCSFSYWIPVLVWQAVLKKTKAKLDLLTDIEMLFMIEKGIRDGIYHAIYQYMKAYYK